MVVDEEGLFSTVGLTRLEYEDIGAALRTVLVPLHPGLAFTRSYLQRVADILAALPVPK